MNRIFEINNPTGAFLAHLEMALLIPGRDLRVLTNRQLSGTVGSIGYGSIDWIR